jgi:hypothetical protein
LRLFAAEALTDKPVFAQAGGHFAVKKEILFTARNVL